MALEELRCLAPPSPSISERNIKIFLFGGNLNWSLFNFGDARELSFTPRHKCPLHSTRPLNDFALHPLPLVTMSEFELEKKKQDKRDRKEFKETLVAVGRVADARRARAAEATAAAAAAAAAIAAQSGGGSSSNSGKKKKRGKKKKKRKGRRKR